VTNFTVHCYLGKCPSILIYIRIFFFLWRYTNI